MVDVRTMPEQAPAGANHAPPYRYNANEMKPDPAPRRVRPYSLGEAFRLTHERWLNRAINHPRRYPTIPSIRVDAGGFDELTDTPLGRSWAEQWWHDTFHTLDTNQPDAGTP